MTYLSSNFVSPLHLSHCIKWGYFPAVNSFSKAQCLLIQDTGIHAQKECGNSINEGNLVLIAAMWTLDLLRQRQVIKGDSTMMIRPSLWLQSFLHLKSFQASGSHCCNWQHRCFTCLLPHVLDFPYTFHGEFHNLFSPSFAPTPLHWKEIFPLYFLPKGCNVFLAAQDVSK